MKLKSLITTIILLILALLLAFYIKNNLSDFSSLSLVSPYLIIFLIILFIFNYFILGLLTKYLISPLNVKIGFFESFQIAVVTGFYNLITPFRGGMAARAVYLKKKHDFSYSDFFASLSASYVIMFFIAGLIGLITSYFIYMKTGEFNIIIFFVFLITFLGMISIIIFSPRLPKTRSSFINKFINVVNGWTLIKNNKKIILVISILTLIQTFVSALSGYLSFHVFGIEISFIEALFLTSIGTISIIIAVTPANLGIGEAIGVFSALTLGITPAQSLTVAVLGRAISFITLFIMGPVFSYKLIHHKPTKP